MKIGNKEFNFNDRPHYMGILNITPDSFSDGGLYTKKDDAVIQSIRLEKEGADILDIGCESTRPGFTKISAVDEITRLLNPLKEILKTVAIPVSIDTYKGRVAEKALALGAHMINDVTGLWEDPYLSQVVAYYKVPICIMVNRRLIEPSGDVFKDMTDFLEKSFLIAKKAGIKEEQIIIDPGIGFGYSIEENFTILAGLEKIKKKYNYPLLLGTSRKGMIWKTLNIEPKDSINGTLATTAIGILKGADIIRVHDVAANRQCGLIASCIEKKS